MINRILGLHHITAIAGSAQANLDFYTKVLGLRLVKKTVNFDDPGTYHLYYGNEIGEPGTILTFFPWEGAISGRIGTGMATEIDYSVPEGTLEFWQDRFEKFNVKQESIAEKMGESYIPFVDPDGLKLNLVISKTADLRTPWVGGEVKTENAIKGFHSVSLQLKNIEPTARILTDIFGYREITVERNRSRFSTDAIQAANNVELIHDPNGRPGHVAAGTNHHVAFRVKDDDVLMEFREKVASRGLGITEKIDRNYFYSIYFREPGGVLFEIASDNPGFTIDEPLNELGTHLKLPAQYESSRSKIETVLPALNI